MYIISACLLGKNCKYNGGNNYNQQVIDFCKTHSYITVCPEVAGKLPCPRPPAEYVGDRVLDKEGKDVTLQFQQGAKAEYDRVLEIAKQRNETIEGAILKANSPSCGSNKIYDGTFSGKLIDGDGCFVKILKENGIPVISEKEKIKW